ncbi:MAG: hypothetical protein IJ207_14105 [Treponema sp.]|uniref:hypothetical protein n=1 Tax=Treponema sp. TaxID=166 RepID=UPI0025CFDFFA|nr:hypothetical protein [Treponema sp.]MBQ9283307.1 hypothetical protein [Treponema sp.]
MTAFTEDRIRKIFAPRSLSDKAEKMMPKTEEMSDGIHPNSPQRIKKPSAMLKNEVHPKYWTL